MMCWGSGLALSGFQQPRELIPLPRILATMPGGLRRDPLDKPDYFSSSHERGSLPPSSFTLPINPSPSLPPVGSH